MSLKTRINKAEKDLNIKSGLPIHETIYFVTNGKPTEEEMEIVEKKKVELDPYQRGMIVYSRWESRSGVINLLQLVRGDPPGELFEGFEFEWDYKQGIGFGSNMILKFVGEFPEDNEFEKDSQIQIMSNGRQKQYSSKDLLDT